MWSYSVTKHHYDICYDTASKKYAGRWLRIGPALADHSMFSRSWSVHCQHGAQNEKDFMEMNKSDTVFMEQRLVDLAFRIFPQLKFIVKAADNSTGQKRGPGAC